MGMACQCSGVAMQTASMSLLSSNVSKILEAFGLSVGLFQRLVQVRLIRIGDRHHVDLSGANHVGEVTGSHIADADEPHTDAVVSGGRFLREGRGG